MTDTATRARPDLTRYCGTLRVGTTYALGVDPDAAGGAGSGSFSMISPSQVEFGGRLRAGSRHDPVHIGLAVTGPESGILRLNGAACACTLTERADGAALRIGFTDPAGVAQDLTAGRDDRRGASGLRIAGLVLRGWRVDLWIGDFA